VDGSRVRIALGVAGGLAALAGAFYGLVALYGADQITRRPRHGLEHDPAAIGPCWEDVCFSSRDGGAQLHGWWFPPRGRREALLFVHGYGAYRVDALWGGDAIARHFVERGYGALLFDLRGHGLSAPARHAFGLTERNDVLGALDLLAARGFPPERVAVIGVSYGAATALLAAPDAPGLAAVVADSGYAEAWPVIRKRMRQVAPLLTRLYPDPAIRWLARRLFGVDLVRARPIEAAERWSGIPVLIVHGLADDYIPSSHAERLHAALPDAELYLVPGAGHAQTFTTDPAAWLARVEAFLERAFARA